MLRGMKKTVFQILEKEIEKPTPYIKKIDVGEFESVENKFDALGRLIKSTFKNSNDRYNMIVEIAYYGKSNKISYEIITDGEGDTLFINYTQDGYIINKELHDKNWRLILIEKNTIERKLDEDLTPFLIETEREELVCV